MLRFTTTNYQNYYHLVTNRVSLIVDTHMYYAYLFICMLWIASTPHSICLFKLRHWQMYRYRWGKIVIHVWSLGKSFIFITVNTCIVYKYLFSRVVFLVFKHSVVLPFLLLPILIAFPSVVWFTECAISLAISPYSRYRCIRSC